MLPEDGVEDSFEREVTRSARVSGPLALELMVSWSEPEKKRKKGVTRVSCQLIPTSQFILILVVLIGLSIGSSLCFGGKLNLVSLFSTLILIPLVIGASTKLRIDFSSKGLKAVNSIQKDMLYDRSVRLWKDLHSVRLRGAGAASSALVDRLFRRQRRLKPQTKFERFLTFLGRGWTKQGFLVFDFKSGGMVAFPLGGFDAANLERLFLTLSRYADPIVLNADVIALQRDILTGGEVQNTLSYTRMWEDSLAERFEVTNFVPLSGGSQLKDGALTILMLLTCSGMSSVYLARDESGKRFIVKELAVPLDNESAGAKLHELFRREAKLLASLNHPNIVSVLDHFVERGRDYLVLEFVPGLTLRQHVKLKGTFSEAEVLEIARQLSDILIYLHGCSPPVVHRDITPDNLIIGEVDRRITLVDFGAASEFVGNMTGTLIGKQCYIPPEQFQGKACPQSDIYAVGATLFYLFTGQDPEPIAVSRPSSQIGTKAGTRREPALSTQFDDLIALMTEQDLDKRLGDACQFELKLNDLQTGVRT